MNTLAALPLALLFAAPTARAQDGPPAIFAKLDYEAALARSREQGRTLILDAMTSWCAPCKQMDRSTWIDPRLALWIERHGLAVQLDMDEHTAVKEALAITAFPTIVLFRGGEEYDRVVGFKTADQMLAWLGGTLEGKRAEDLMLERLATLRASDPSAEVWDQRSHLAQDLLFAGANDEALAELLWLYATRDLQAADARAWFWTRHFYDAQGLAERSAQARTAFAELRGELTPRVTAGSADEEALRDWIRLGFVAGDSNAVFDWADEQARTAEGVASLRRFETLLFAPLVEAGRWRTAGLVLADPLRQVRFMRDTLGAYDEPLEARAGGVVPAIPMGGPKPADAGRPKVIPAIPLAGTKPAPAVPDAKREGKALPMIPMLGGAKTEGEAVDASSAEAARSAEIRRRLTEEFRREAATRYAALLAAGREDEALEVAGLLIGELDDARARAALVAAALRAGALDAALERHQAWLDEAAL